MFAEKKAASERKRQEIKLAKQVQRTLGYCKHLACILGENVSGRANELTAR